MPQESLRNMKRSCVFFVANPGTQLEVSRKLVNTIVNGLETNSHAATRQADGWSLEHRIFRDTSAPGAHTSGSPSTHVYSYQHLIHLSFLDPDRTYTFTQYPIKTEPGSQTAKEYSAGSMICIPASQMNSHASMITNVWGQLWSPQRTIEVIQGTVYRIREFTIHIGELQAKRPILQQSNVSSPGVVVCISAPAGPADAATSNSSTQQAPTPAELEDLQSSLRNLWKHMTKGVELGKGEVREFPQSYQDPVSQEGLEQESAIRMWCEALRIRGGQISQGAGPFTDADISSDHHTHKPGTESFEKSTLSSKPSEDQDFDCASSLTLSPSTLAPGSPPATPDYPPNHLDFCSTSYLCASSGPEQSPSANST